MIGAAIAAGSNILGGILGSRDKDKDRAAQKQFAQNGIQWKVEDAKKAGIHPLFALGANTTSFAPVSVGGPSIASGLADAGQNIGRAIDTTRSASAKLDAYGKTAQALQLTRMGLENELLASQIATTRQGSNPPLPTAGDRMLIPGQGDSPLDSSGRVKTSPMARQSTAVGATSQEAGAVPEMGYLRTPSGWAPVMSKDAKDRSEDDIGAELSWLLRNRILPSVGAQHQPPADVPLKPDHVWKWNPIKQEYYQQKRPNNWFSRSMDRR